MRDQRLEKLAKVLVEYATEVKKGDKVAISGEEIAIPFIQAVAKEVVKKGGIMQYYIDCPEVDAALLKNGTEEQIAQPNFFFGECAKSDVWISAWGSKNTKTMQSVDNDVMRMRRIANKENRKIYTTRTGDGSLRWCGTQFPTDGDAQLGNMSLEEYEEFVYEAGFLNEEDPVAKWKEVEAYQDKWVNHLNGTKELHIVTKGTDLKVNCTDRTWVNCCGKENFPDGEIFTSPVAEGTNGMVTYSYPSINNGQEFEEVCFVVKEGKVVSATCKNEDMLEKLLTYLDTDEGSRYFGEVAIGTNYHIKKHTKNILFDEKIGGSMHLAIGQSFPEAGGINESSIHWDMITDMTVCGKIYADGKLFYENGKFIEEVLG